MDFLLPSEKHFCGLCVSRLLPCQNVIGLYIVTGTNCAYDVNTALKVMERMKAALVKEDLHPYLSCQPLGMMCPEVEESPVGYLALPEFPLGKYMFEIYLRVI